MTALALVVSCRFLSQGVVAWRRVVFRSVFSIKLSIVWFGLISLNMRHLLLILYLPDCLFAWCAQEDYI